MSSEHAILLKESVADFVARRMSIARVRALRNTPLEYERELWKEIAALGWLGVSIPERTAACPSVSPKLRWLPKVSRGRLRRSHSRRRQCSPRERLRAAITKR